MEILINKDDEYKYDGVYREKIKYVAIFHSTK